MPEEAARAIVRVVSLVADLLDSSRLEQGLFALDRQPVNLADLVRETSAALATDAVPVRVDSSVSVALSGDANRIRQALENVLSNAIRFSPAGTSVDVGLDLQADDAGHWAVVTVADQGPGIPRSSSRASSTALPAGQIHRVSVSVSTSPGASSAPTAEH